MSSLLAASRLLPASNATLAARQLSTATATTTTAQLPRIAQPSLWSSLVPKFLRRHHPSHDTVGIDAVDKPPSRFRQWLGNPSTSLIAIALLTGSQAIQVLQLRNEIEERSRASRKRLNHLKNVLRRIQDGEKVDLRKELGTGDPEAEKEWQDAVDQLADEDFWLRPKYPKPEREKALPDAGSKEYSHLPTAPPVKWKPGNGAYSLWQRAGKEADRKTAEVANEGANQAANQAANADDAPKRRAFY